LLIPVAGISASQIEDTFGDARGDSRHEALDIMAPAGTPVVAAADGTIEKLFVSGDGGNSVYIRSGDRSILYYYAHLQAYGPGLREGQPVARGQALGTVGSTGNADSAAPHLHFAIVRTSADAEWWKPGVAMNPYPLLVSDN
jgi:murein DD-endopeptidase MepM/ murein hydrolase activator NlpD